MGKHYHAIGMIMALIKKDKDIIINEFINDIELNYEIIAKEEDNPFTSLYDMIDTEFLSMGSDHHDYTRDTLEKILTALWGSELYGFANEFIMENDTTHYDLSTVVYANYIDSVLLDMVKQHGGNQ
jgi:hypothetical protein